MFEDDSKAAHNRFEWRAGICRFLYHIDDNLRRCVRSIPVRLGLLFTRSGTPTEDAIPELQPLALSSGISCGIKNGIVCGARKNG